MEKIRQTKILPDAVYPPPAGGSVASPTEAPSTPAVPFRNNPLFQPRASIKNALEKPEKTAFLTLLGASFMMRGSRFCIVPPAKKAVVFF